MKTKRTVSHKSKLFSPLFLIVILFSFTIPCQAADIYVDDDACPGNGSGTSGDPYCSIADAITDASSGDDVLVYAGNYAERIFMKTGVDVRNAEATRPVIEQVAKTLVKFGDNTPTSVNNCTLDGFVLDTSITPGPANAAVIYVYSGCTNVTITNCEINGSSTPGVSDYRTGIRFGGQVEINIIGNTISNFSKCGITTHWVGTINNSTVTIQGNTIQGNGIAGIYIKGANATANNRVIIGGSGINDGNLITNNGVGIDEKGSGIRLNLIDKVSIENNTIQNSRRAGILLLDTTSVSPHITGNSIHDNTESGINIGGDSPLTIGSNNEIYNNGVSGISFFVFRNSANSTAVPSSQPVLITGNDIYGNTKAGIAVIDRVTGVITIDGNTIHQNTQSGIAFFSTCTATITDNDIHTHTGAAGIFTGDWSGTYPPVPDSPPSTVAFDRARGPATLTIRRNKVHGNQSGMRLDHASGVITNNLVYNNSRSGIRFSGNIISPYTPFTFPLTMAPWGITQISNNTVVDNGSYVAALADNRGGGIIYDDINTLTSPETGLPRNFFDYPLQDPTQDPRIIKNNITAYNMKSGIRDAVCGTERDYNLYYGNHLTTGEAKEYTQVARQTGGCMHGIAPNFTGNPNELFADPLFVDRAGANYQLQAGSPGKNSGDDGNDMGAFGGSDPITL